MTVIGRTPSTVGGSAWAGAAATRVASTMDSDIGTAMIRIRQSKHVELARDPGLFIPREAGAGAWSGPGGAWRPGAAAPRRARAGWRGAPDRAGRSPRRAARPAGPRPRAGSAAATGAPRRSPRACRRPAGRPAGAARVITSSSMAPVSPAAAPVARPTPGPDQTGDRSLPPRGAASGLRRFRLICTTEFSARWGGRVVASSSSLDGNGADRLPPWAVGSVTLCAHSGGAAPPGSGPDGAPGSPVGYHVRHARAPEPVVARLTAATDPARAPTTRPPIEAAVSVVPTVSRGAPGGPRPKGTSRASS